MESWVEGLYAITLFVEDVRASSLFYQETFGLPIVFEDAHSAIFAVGTTLVNLLDIGDAPELIAPAQVAARDDGTRFLLTVHVDDVDAICAKLTRRGIELLNGPVDRQWGVRTASFCDLSGNIWEIAR